MGEEIEDMEDHPLYPEGDDRIEWSSPILDTDKMSEEDAEEYQEALQKMFEFMQTHMEIAKKYSEGEE